MITAPPARRQIVGGALRRYRENLGWTLADTARVLDCDPSKVSRIETGERGLRATELLALLAEYGAGEDAQAALVAIAGSRATAGWWSGHDLSQARRDYMTLEALAAQACYYAPLQVPELLQDPAYAEAQAEAHVGLATGAEPNRAVEALLARQDAILDGTRDLKAVISEAALRQMVGRPSVMRQQAAHLAALSESGRVEVQVLPFRALAHPAPASGSVTILRFGGTGGIPVAWLDGIAGSQFLAAEDAAPCIRAWEQLRMYALSREESAALLRRLAIALALSYLARHPRGGATTCLPLTVTPPSCPLRPGRATR
jgi:transcriptional regulator with XRE-family HTH domain